MGARQGAAVSATWARTFAVALTVVTGLGATSMFLQYGAADGLQVVDLLRSVLILLSTSWLAWGASQGLIGLWPRRIDMAPRLPIGGRTVVLVPVYN